MNPTPVATQTELVTQAAPVIDRGLNLATSEVLQRKKQIVEIMEKVMKPNVHFGIIPGTQKPTIYQPGADALNVTFRIAPIVALVEEQRTDDGIRYRITVRGEHQVTKETLAEGIGSCSSDEEKYRWRKPVCDEEFNETPEHLRRQKWRKGQGKPWREKQIRTSPADVENTILKMAVKRAKIAMTLNATGAADVFHQDLEDLSDELRETLAEEGTPMPKAAERQSQQQPPAQDQAHGQQQPAPSSQTGNGAALQQTQGPAPQVQQPATPKGPSNIGVITDVKVSGDAILVMLDTGFKCSTRDQELQQSVGRLRDSKRPIECVTRASSDPKKYAPILTGIEFPADDVEPAK